MRPDISKARKSPEAIQAQNKQKMLHIDHNLYAKLDKKSSKGSKDTYPKGPMPSYSDDGHADAQTDDGRRLILIAYR